VEERRYWRHRFAQRYSRADIALLAEVDEAHETLSGPATRQILKRELEHYGEQRFKQLAGISVAQIYNLRKSRNYREKRLRYEKTRPVQIASENVAGQTPQGKPGYLRVDTVHQRDLDGVKGVYHINAVDEVMPMASGRRHGTDRRTVANASAGSHAGPVSLPCPGFSLRQRAKMQEKSFEKDARGPAARKRELCVRLWTCASAMDFHDVRDPADHNEHKICASA
jgi:hypothetical protein